MATEPAHPWVEEVRRARRGDNNAFAALVRSMQRQVYGLCLRLLRTERALVSVLGVTAAGPSGPARATLPGECVEAPPASAIDVVHPQEGVRKLRAAGRFSMSSLDGIGTAPLSATARA